jgi:4-diphosphocytidyl-2-C-methyl-D-erythritol kinase
MESPDIEGVRNPTLEENLVYRAAVLLREETGTKKGARITLTKEIPLSAGLGGGSSDAVQTLIGLDRLWGLNLGKGKLGELALRLGSDTLFFLDGPAALIEGRGERVAPVEMEKSYPIVLLNPGFGVSTKWAYSQGAPCPDIGGARSPAELTKKPNDIKLLIRAVRTGDFSLLRSRGYEPLRFSGGNDFTVPVTGRYPVLRQFKERLRENGALYAEMSGSGPTVFGVFKDAEGAEAARKAVIAEGFVTPIAEGFVTPWARVVETLV